jgi:hypothetical protein
MAPLGWVLLAMILVRLLSILLLIFRVGARAHRDSPLVSTIVVGNIVLFVFGIAIGLFWLADAWRRIPESERYTASGQRVSPGHAAGGVFIPFYNLWWIFVANVGLCSATNRQLERLGSRTRAPAGLAVFACIVQLVPYVNLVLAPLVWAGFAIAVDGAQREMQYLLALESSRMTGRPAPQPVHKTTARDLTIGLAVPSLVIGMLGVSGFALGYKSISPPPAGADVGATVEIPGGTLPNIRSVTRPAPVVAPFSIDRTEVKVASYRLCVKTGPCEPPDTKFTLHASGGCTYRETGNDDLPINCIDYDEAKDYCAWVGKRLPTEDEWESALRGSTTANYPWGTAPSTDDADACWHVSSPCRVGSHARDRSPFGVLDLAGNVKEFTSTPYSRPGDESVLTDDFATKGGSFASYDATSDEREAEMPSISSDTEKGFRCAK